MEAGTCTRILSELYSSGAMRSSVVVEMVPSACGTVSVSFFSVEQLSRPYVLVRTGQPHRTLLGHTGPVTCLQFDELHVVSGSLDKSLRVS